MVEFYSRSHAFRYGRQNTSSGFRKNRTHDLRSTVVVGEVGVRGYLLDHLGDEYKLKMRYKYLYSALLGSVRLVDRVVEYKW